MNNATKNNSVIENAFARLRTNANVSIRKAMVNALRAGVDTALYIHDKRHQKHIKTGGSYGWALWLNGQYIDGEINAHGAEDQGTAEAAIKAVNPRAAGYYGVVMAGMGEAYYALDYERDILNLTADEIGRNFTNYFKQI